MSESKLMKTFFVNIVVLLSVCASFISPANGQIKPVNKTHAQLPYLKSLHNHTQLMVDGKPFLMVAGELHNSTSSTSEYFGQAMQNAKAMHVNTVIASIAWEQFEPKEGVFDYSFIDYILSNANKLQLKVVLIWFATWKNGESSYAPLWVKQDTKRFFRIRNKAGEMMTAISPFCEEAMRADANAFGKLMKYIKEKDIHHTIIMMQPENEVGAFSEMDYNAIAVKKYNEPVPQQLVNYLLKNEQQLEHELKAAWMAQGARKSGTWAEIFGEKNCDAQNFFMSWQYATFVNEVCKQGKNSLPLPMFVNAWLVQYPGEIPGKYPNGGPVSRVMDIYKAAASVVDFISPDIYLPNFKEVCSMYSRPAKQNPLFIPECERSNPGKAYYALAEHNALGFGPFGIESLIADNTYSLSFQLLKEELLPTIIQYQGTGKMKGILKEADEDTTNIVLGKYRCAVQFMDKTKQAYGVIIQTDEDEFLIAGINMKVSFHAVEGNSKTYIGQVQEGGFVNNSWQTYRYLNGDETWHNSFLFVTGRSYSVEQKNNNVLYKKIVTPLPVLNSSLEKGLDQKRVESPGIYRAKLYGLR